MTDKFSLLNSLSAANEAAKLVPPTKSYHIYFVETEEHGTRKIGIPLENVAAFDLHFEENPDDLGQIDTLIEAGAFNAVLLD